MENMHDETRLSIASAVKAALPGNEGRRTELMPALVLAYVGDTVYDLYVRTMLAMADDSRVHELHLSSAKHVCAAGQAAALRRIEPLLTEAEAAIYRRGRNSHMGTVPKNASIADYRTATGLEALVGYLYLSGNDSRLTLLMRAALCAQKSDAEVPCPQHPLK